jgi:organic radical activating enzyme
MMKLPFAEFYITNVCDLACENCNRFNNFQRKGRVNWDESQYVEFAKHLDIEIISIIGGEPLNHPGINDYIKGIRKLWPNSQIVIATNGLAINRRKHLYEYCTTYNVSLEISFHDTNEIDGIIMQELDKFKEQNGTEWLGPITETLNHIDRNGKPFTTEAQHLQESKGLQINFTPAYDFGSNAIERSIGINTPIPHNSDPERAYHVCGMKNSPTFHDGKFYKCGMIAAGKEFVTEYNAQEHWKELFEYSPVTAKDLSNDKWKENFWKAEAVCKLCPDVIKYNKVKTKLKASGQNK